MKAFQLTAFGAKVSKSPSFLFQLLALSLSTVVPELRQLEYQWMGLAKFKNLIVLYFTKARLTQTLRICCHHELHVSRNQPEAERFSPTFNKSFNTVIRVMEFSKQRNGMQERDLQFALRVVEGGKSLSAAELIFVRLIYYLCPHVQLCHSIIIIRCSFYYSHI